MPLRVHCPNGCLIRLPSNRAGKVVRCPECKTAIRIGSPTKSANKSGKPVPMNAETVEVVPKQKVEQANAFPTIDTGDDRPRLAVRPKISIPRTRFSEDDPSETLDVSALVKPNAAKAIEPIDANEIAPLSTAKLKSRVRNSNANRTLLLRVFAASLCVLGVVNMIPAAYQWIQWSQMVETQTLPRWIYLQIFVAAIHFVYAVFLFQIPDWSTLRTVAIAMLGVAFAFGVVSAGLLVGGGNSVIARGLELPHILVKQGCIWCVAMLTLSTLLSYMMGRESLLWQQTEKLLSEILSARTVQNSQ